MGATIEFRFDEKKAAQAAAYLLRRHGGQMNYMMLIKLLYLSDRALFVKRGRSITGDMAFSMKHGPVLSRIMNFLKRDARTSVPTVWTNHISEPIGYDVKLLAESATDELSRTELKILETIDTQYGWMNEWDLVNLLHTILPEPERPVESGRRPIIPDQILRDERATDEEIDQIRQEIRELAAVDNLLR